MSLSAALGEMGFGLPTCSLSLSNIFLIHVLQIPGSLATTLPWGKMHVY